jgi:hypothetical protein
LRIHRVTDFVKSVARMQHPARFDAHSGSSKHSFAEGWYLRRLALQRFLLRMLHDWKTIEYIVVGLLVLWIVAGLFAAKG